MDRPPTFGGAIPPGWLPAGLVAAARPLDGPVPALWLGEDPGPGAVEIRRREFAVGRACFRDALVGLGHAPVAVPRRADRTPALPAGVVGSLSHSRVLAVAVLGRVTDVRSVGVDVEPDGPLAPELVALVATPEERERPEPKRLFGAKEAAFKAWFTAGGGRIADFEEFVLGFHDDGTFTVVRQPAPRVAFDGRWARSQGHWWCVAVVR